MDKAITQGLIKKINPYAPSDIIRGLFLGITQVMDMKATKHTDSDKRLKSKLAEAEKLLACAIVLKRTEFSTIKQVVCIQYLQSKNFVDGEVFHVERVDPL